MTGSLYPNFPIYNAVYLEKCYEIVIVDNGLNNKLYAFAEKHPIQVMHHTDFASAAYARNKGANSFTDGILVFIDSDVIVEKECIHRLTRPIEDKKEVATIGNYSTDVEGLNFAQRYKQLYIHHIYNKNNDNIKNDFWTAISAIDSSVFHELNGFDHSFLGANGEDQEFGIRLTANNYSATSVTNANGKHIHPYTVKGLINNDFKKGMTAMSNSLKNRVPLKDNRHAKLRSIYAVLFATLFTISIISLIVNYNFIYLAFGLIAIWFILRLNLINVYLKSQSVVFTIKSIALIYILDLVRFASVFIGYLKNSFVKIKEYKTLIFNQ